MSLENIVNFLANFSQLDLPAENLLTAAINMPAVKKHSVQTGFSVEAIIENQKMYYRYYYQLSGLSESGKIDNKTFCEKTAELNKVYDHCFPKNWY